MKNLLNKLSEANRALNTVNNTAYNVRRTKSNVDHINSSNQRKQQEKAAQRSLEWKCACGKKCTTKFCDGCGAAKPACPNCGAAPTGSKFCGECGTPMGE
ncbi:MAG: hypothetical protein FWG45_07560 [Oscillospiraceae bacterium]|nr:hypothetical protein [Oscillospiraceae bacterium]